MEFPTISNLAVDKTGVKYNVVAYRKLSPAEITFWVRHHLAQIPKRKRPKPGASVRIVTLIE